MKTITNLLILLFLAPHIYAQSGNDYDEFLDILYNNDGASRTSAGDLILAYNSFHDAVIDASSRSYIETCLKRVSALDSLYCEFKRMGNKDIVNIVRELKPGQNHTLYELYEDLEGYILGVEGVAFTGYCEFPLPAINYGDITLMHDSTITEEQHVLVGESGDTLGIVSSTDPNTEESSVIVVNSENSIKAGGTSKDTMVVRTHERTEGGISVTEASDPSIMEFNPPVTSVTFNSLVTDDTRIYLTEGREVYLEFCFVQKGTFNLGITSIQYSEVLSQAGDKAFELNVQDEVAKPETRYVETSEAFLISKYELSRDQFELVVMGGAIQDSQVMTNISEEELHVFLQRLNDKFPDLYFDIPTEIEWEFAAKGASENYYISTNNYFDIDDQINVNSDTGAGSIYRPNALCSWVNACNMIGNAKEICYANHAYYTSAFNTHAVYVARGGSFLEDRFSARTTSRHVRNNIKGEDIGLRLIIRKKK